jgi:hypothetical protein
MVAMGVKFGQCGTNLKTLASKIADKTIKNFGLRFFINQIPRTANV